MGVRPDASFGRFARRPVTSYFAAAVFQAPFSSCARFLAPSSFFSSHVVEARYAKQHHQILERM
jgi:hypothetical protein